MRKYLCPPKSMVVLASVLAVVLTLFCALKLGLASGPSSTIVLYPYVTPPTGISSDSVPDNDPIGVAFIIPQNASLPFGLTADPDPQGVLAVNAEAIAHPTWTWTTSGDMAFRAGTSGTWLTSPYGGAGGFGFSLQQTSSSSPIATLTTLTTGNATLGYWKIPLHVHVVWDDGQGNVWTGDGDVDLYVHIMGIEKLQWYNGSSFVDVTRTIHVFKGTTVTFKAVRPNGFNFPSGQPSWTGASPVAGHPDQATATFMAAGNVSATYGNTVTANVDISAVSLQSITFTGGNGLQSDDGTYQSNGTGAVRIPQFVVGATPVATPICYNWNSSPGMQASFKIAPAADLPASVTIHAAAVQSGRTGTLAYDKSSTFSGASGTATLSTTSTLPQLIDNTSYDITWTVSFDGGSTYQSAGSSNNTLFVTAGAPTGATDTVFGSTPASSTATVSRVNWATGIAKGANSITAAAEDFRDSISKVPGFTAPRTWNLQSWQFLDSGDHGDCITLAKLSATGLAMAGVPSQYRWSFPTADASGLSGFPATVSATTCTNKATTTFAYNGQTFNACLVYPGNNFEGFFTVTDGGTVKAYTVFTAKGPYSNQTYYYLQVLNAFASDQFWVWDGNQTAGGVTVSNWGSVPNAAHISVPAVP